jgi:hypothetical protein
MWAHIQKLMLESDRVLNNEQRPNHTRHHRKSLSACDELEYHMEIFKAKTNFDFMKEPQPNTLKKTISMEDDEY